MVGVDDGNDHTISIWEWENKKKIAEHKVGLHFILSHVIHCYFTSRVRPMKSFGFIFCRLAMSLFWP